MRPFRRHPRAPLLDLLTTAKGGVALGELRRHTGFAEQLETAAVRRVRVELARDDARDARLEQRIDAWRSRSVVSAGLQRHVHRRAACTLACIGEGGDLGVRRALAFVPALTHDLALTHDDRADDRIGSRRAAAALGELDGALEKAGLHGSDPTAPP